MFFSIIIPTYNRAGFLPKAIESVLAQTYTDWELIIVDDGSTDNTKEVVLQYKDARIRYIYQQNAERSAARNNGINHANGDYVCFMDSDEYVDSNRLELLCNSIDKTSIKCACFYTDIRFEGIENYLRKGKAFSFPINKDELIRFVIGTPQICCATKIMRKHQFNPQISIGEDMELLFRITDEFPLVYLPNQETIVEFEHEGRSVAQGSVASEKQLQTLQLMFSGNHPANKVSSKMKRWLKSAVLFNASKNYILEGKIKGLQYLLRSIIIKPIQKNTKYKLNILFSYIFRKQKLRELLAYE